MANRIECETLHRTPSLHRKDGAPLAPCEHGSCQKRQQAGNSFRHNRELFSHNRELILPNGEFSGLGAGVWTAPFCVGLVERARLQRRKAAQKTAFPVLRKFAGLRGEGARFARSTIARNTKPGEPSEQHHPGRRLRYGRRAGTRAQAKIHACTAIH
jgi:hypothetical protein